MINYEKDSHIDINALDIEWLKIPNTEAEYIKEVKNLKDELTQRIEEHKLAHEKVKTVRSVLLQRVHADPEKYIGKAKATGPEAEAFYRTHKKYKKAKENEINAEMAVIRAEDDFNTAKDMKDLIHFTKTKSIENLVILHGQGYFAGPKVPRDIKRELERYQEKEENNTKRSKRIGKGLKRGAKGKRVKK